jgi:hypothetical protein
VRALENLLIPFGYDEERIRSEAAGTVQTEVRHVWRFMTAKKRMQPYGT